MLPGYGLQIRSWPQVSAVQGNGDRSRSTVNDILVTALIAAISRWNSAHGVRPGPLKITIPVNWRPPGGAATLGNLARLGAVTATAPALRAGYPQLLAEVSRQTRLVKRRPGRAVALPCQVLAALPCPAPVKRLLLRAGVRLLGSQLCDTSLLSNLGVITDPPRFGAAAPAAMWFSTPAHMPRGLSVGALTVGGRLQLCFRYRRALFDEEAAADFAAGFAAVLSEVAGRPGGAPQSPVQASADARAAPTASR